VIRKVYAKAALINPSGKILLLKRSQTDERRPGEWDLPGGEIEAEEDIAAGLRREIIEETGIEVMTEQLKLLFTGTKFWEEGKESVSRLLYRADVAKTEIALSHEHEEYQWVDIPTALADFPHWFYNAGLRYAIEYGLITE
jgi:8-oxo-dGTP diphosphatase